MTNLEQRISQLTDDEALDAASFLAGWLREQVKAKGRLAPNILEGIPDEATAVDILEEILPELGDPLRRIASDEKRKGQVARNFLLLLAQKEDYASELRRALDHPVLKGEILTTALALGLLYFFTLEFELKVEEVDGQTRKRFRISRKATSITELIGILKKKLGL